MSMTQPEFSLTALTYTVSLTRVTGSGQALCLSLVENRPAETISDNSISITGLQEFSTYSVTVNATFDVVVNAFDGPGIHSFEITTLGTLPTAAPSNLTLSQTSTSVNFTWDSIECSERNGHITGYEVELQEEGGTVNRREMVTAAQYFSSGLTPYTNYTFLIAGINANGTGISYVGSFQTNESSE